MIGGYSLEQQPRKSRPLISDDVVQIGEAGLLPLAVEVPGDSVARPHQVGLEKDGRQQTDIETRNGGKVGDRGLMRDRNTLVRVASEVEPAARVESFEERV